MIKAAIFDVGGVLTSLKNGSTSKEIQKKLGFDDITMVSFWNYYMSTFGSGKIDEATFWDEVHKCFGGRKITTKDNLFGRTFSGGLKVHRSLLSFIKGLSRQGIKVAVLSDTNVIHASILREKGVYDPFDYIFLSHETGIRKPDPMIFNLIIRELKLDPKMTVYIDDLPINLETAAKVGMQTILAHNPKQVIEDIEVLLK